MSVPEQDAPPAPGDRSAPDRAGWTRASVLVLAGLCALAAMLRLAHLDAIAAADPFFEIPSVDGQLYDAWARRILAGQPFDDQVLFLGPLYPFFLAGVYGVFGPSLAALKAVQVGLGVLSVALVAGLAREVFDRRVALVAAAFAATNLMLIFYGGTVMVVNLQVPLVLALLWAAVRALRRPSALRWLALGLLFAAVVLARQTAALLGPLLLVALGVEHGRALGAARVAGLVACFGVGVAVPTLPFTWHNYRASGELIWINSTGGANLFMGNGPWANGAWAPPRIVGYRVDHPLAMRRAFTEVAERELGRSLGPSEVSRFWMERTAEAIAQDPGRWLRLELRKLLLFLNAHEVWNNRSIEVSRDFSWVLRLPLPGFGVVAPLGLLGIALSARRFRRLFPLHALLAVYLAAALVFFVLSRYRMPSVPVLMIFAGAAVVWLVDTARGGPRRRLAPALAALAVFAAVSHWPLARDSLYMAYFNLGNKYKELERWDEAIRSYERSLALQPGFVSTHNNLALAYEGAGRSEEAVESWRRVRRWSVDHGDAQREARARRHLAKLGAPADP